MIIVIALGGNALGIDPKEQRKNVSICAKYLAQIINTNNKVIITHGNGPQVGLINLAFSTGHKIDSNIYEMEFSECGAMSQAYIGYHLTEAINNELKKINSNKKLINILTNVLVDKDDKAFQNPTKPIGPFLSKDEALKFPYPTKEDSGRGYRRVIASPKPIKIIEEDQIETLINNDYTVICCGGGGIPVIETPQGLKGIDAVIDKDYASSTLANNIDADMLIILTQVENAKINFGKTNEQNLYNIKVSKINEYLQNDEFKAGSMKPKVEACINFINNQKQKKRIAVITDMKNLSGAINLEKGTIIEK